MAEMLKKGLKHAQIARALKLDRKTVIRYAKLWAVDKWFDSQSHKER